MAAMSAAGLLSVVACLFLSPVTDASPYYVGGCVSCGKDVGNTLNDPNSGSQCHFTVAATYAPLVGVTFQVHTQSRNVILSTSLPLTIMNTTTGPHVGMVVYYCTAVFERGRTNETTRAGGPAIPNRAYEDHVLGHNGVGPITTAAVQEEGKKLPSQPVFPTGGHNIQREEPVTTAPGRRDPIGHGIPATNTAQQVTISAPVAETGAGKTTQPVYGVPTNHSSGTNRQTEETGGGFPSQAVFPTWRRVPPCHGLLGANRAHQVNCSAPVAESGTGKTAQLVVKQLSA